MNNLLNVNISSLNNKIDIVIYILKTYNCRVSEVLSAKWENFYQDKYLILEGLKGSRNIFIRDSLILNRISNLTRDDDKLIFKYVKYSTIYYYLKKYYSHLGIFVKRKKNVMITHAFRYLNVKFLDNDKFIRDALYHSSIKSNKYYINKL